MKQAFPVVVLLNPRAGRARARRRALAALRADGADARVVETRDARDGADEAAAAAREGARVVVAAGGDGTVQAVVRGLLRADADARPALAVAPLGRGNDLARALGLARDDACLARAVRAEREAPLDVGRVRVDGVEHPFTCGVGLGLVGRIARLGKRLPLPGGAAYTAAALLSLLGGRRAWRVTGSFDDEPIDVRASILGIGNGSHTGGGYRMHPGALLGDGWLDACLCEVRSRAGLLRLMPRVRRGTHADRAGVRTRRLRAARVRLAPPAPVHADGEVLSPAASEVVVDLRRGGLRVRLPG